MLTKYHSVFLGVGLSIGARGVSALLGLVSVPLLLNHFGTKEYGVWVFILSISAMLSFLDLGVGNALLNRSALLMAKGMRDELRTLVGTSLLGLSSLSVLALLGLIILHRSFPLSSIIALEGEEIDRAIFIYLAFLFLTIPLASIQRLQIGIGKGWLNPLTNIAASISGFAVILYGCHASLGLNTLVLAYCITQWITTLTSVVFFLAAEGITPNFARDSASAFGGIIRQGTPFLLLQISAILGSQADNFLVARYAGTSSLATYSIAVKVFQLIALAPSLTNTFLWPLYTAASARNDDLFIYRTLSRVLMAFVAYGLLSGIAITISFPWLSEIWLHRTDIQPPVFLLLGLTTWLAVESCGNSVNTVQNALSRMKAQLVLALLFGTSVIACKYWFLRSSGITSLPWASCLAYMIVAMPYYMFEVWRIRRAAQPNQTRRTR